MARPIRSVTIVTSKVVAREYTDDINIFDRAPIDLIMCYAYYICSQIHNIIHVHV